MNAFCCPAEIDILIESAQENLATNPGYADLCNQLGLLFTLNKNYEEARTQFQRALTINPFYAEARRNLAFLHMDQRDLEAAESVLRECVETKPEDGLSHHLLGVLLLIRGERIMATRNFERAARLDPCCRLEYEELGAFRNGRLNLDGSTEKRLREGAERVRRVSLHHFVGQCYMDMGETEKALQEFRKTSRIDPRDYQCHLNMGKLYDLEGKYGKAIEELQKAIDIYPDCGMAYAHMSYAHAGRGDLRKALAALERAVEIHPNYADLRYQLGLLYEDLDMYPEAIAELIRALQINPKYLFARINLGVLYEKTGQVEKALGEFERVAELVTEDVDLVDRIDELRKKTSGSPCDRSNRLEPPNPS
jgi:tetratricopeptide (TPR) repeat protein